MKIHELKTVQPHFTKIVNGTKTFECRLNDRQYSTGDLLTLREWNPTTETYSGDYQLVKVTHILHVFEGLKEGYCILSIKLIN